MIQRYKCGDNLVDAMAYMKESSHGDYVYFSDHEKAVGELREAHKFQIGMLSDLALSDTSSTFKLARLKTMIARLKTDLENENATLTPESTSTKSK